MATSIKKTCPNCNHIIENWHLDNGYWILNIGNPIVICPSCKTILVDKNIKEAIMLKWYDYLRIIISDIICSLVAAGLLLIFTIFVFKLNLTDENYLALYIVFLLVIATIIINKFNNDISKSKERTSDKSYYNLLKKLNLINKK